MQAQPQMPDDSSISPGSTQADMAEAGGPPLPGADGDLAM
jgi:hypothetical protein